MKYEFIRHTTFRDFAVDCVPFVAKPCPRCGKMPEQPAWITCWACQCGIVRKQKAQQVAKARRAQAAKARRAKHR